MPIVLCLIASSFLSLARASTSLQVKRSLLAGLVEAADQFNNENIDVFAKNEQLRTGCRYCCYTTLRWCNNHLPLTHDVRSVEARYGQNVASFFHFLRYVIFCFALLSVFNLATYTWHISDIMYNGNNLALTISKSRELQGSCIWDESRSHTVCSIKYDEKETPRWDNSKDGLAWFDNLEHWKSVAALPSAFGFSQQEDENSHSSFVYAFNMVISTVVLAVMALVKLIREDRVFKIVHSTDGGESNDFPKLTFGKLFFICWALCCTTTEHVDSLVVFFFIIYFSSLSIPQTHGTMESPSSRNHGIVNQQ